MDDTVEMDDKLAFVNAVKKYDCSYEMSDDHSVWQRGREYQHKLRVMAAALNNTYGEGTAQSLWKDAMAEFGINAKYMTSTGAEA